MRASSFHRPVIVDAGPRGYGGMMAGLEAAGARGFELRPAARAGGGTPSSIGFFRPAPPTSGTTSIEVDGRTWFALSLSDYFSRREQAAKRLPRGAD